MGIRQPDECFCFGGKCWKYLCYKKAKKEPDVHTVPPEHNKARPTKILTLRDSLKELAKNKELENNE